jgi:hypothetical protein
MATFNITSGLSQDANAVINGASCQDGDTIQFPAGNYTWTEPFSNVTSGGTPKQVKVLGAGGGCNDGPGLTKISGSNVNNLIIYQCKNITTTAEIGHIELYGEYNCKLKIEGVGVISGVNEDQGGIALHQINFSSDFSQSKWGTAIGGRHMGYHGWVFGVMWHCKISDCHQRVGSQTMNIGHSQDPTGTGPDSGAYAFSFPTDGSGVTATKDMFYLEDNIFHHTGSQVDSGAQSGTGSALCPAGIYCARHNTEWGPFGTHGTREGSTFFGGRSMEHYNNICCYTNGYTYTQADGGTFTGDTKNTYQGAEYRCGEVVAYNNFMSNVLLNGSGHFQKTKWGGGSNYAITCAGDPIYGNGPDGLSPWDENVRDSPYTDQDGRVHQIDTGYTYKTVSGGIDSVSTNGHVYGHATSVTTPNIVTVKCTILNGAGAIPTTVDYWRGFIIRNADTARDQVAPVYPFLYIIGSSVDGTGVTTLNCLASNTGSGTSRALDTAGSHFELRRVKTYFCVVGSGQITGGVRIVNNHPNPFTLSGGSPNPRWANQKQEGCWCWGNMYRDNTTQNNVNSDNPTPPWKVETRLTILEPAGDYGLSCAGGFHQWTGGFANNPSAITKPGYPYDRTVPKQIAGVDNPVCRVGADWVAQFPDTMPYAISNTGAFGSFVIQGAGGYTYPHPIRAKIEGTGPADDVITTSAATATIAGGNTITFTVNDVKNASSTVTVNYTFGTSSGDNAQQGSGAGKDYTASQSGSLTISAGSSSKSLAIDIAANPGQADRQATFHISSVSGGTNASVGTQPNTVLTITNTVEVTVSIDSPNRTSVTEGASSVFTIHATGNVPGNTTINYAMSGTAVSGTNYTALSGTAVIASGTSSKDVTISTITVAGVQPSLTAVMTLNTGSGYVLGTTTTATLVIEDDAASGGPPPPNIVISG